MEAPEPEPEYVRLADVKVYADTLRGVNTVDTTETTETPCPWIGKTGVVDVVKIAQQAELVFVDEAVHHILRTHLTLHYDGRSEGVTTRVATVVDTALCGVVGTYQG